MEAEREKNAYHLTEKDKEIQRLREQLKAKYSTTALLEQLEEKTKEGERREQLLKSLSEETDVLKKQLSATTARLAELESKASTLRLSQVLAISLNPDFFPFLIQFVVLVKNEFVKTHLSMMKQYSIFFYSLIPSP